MDQSTLLWLFFLLVLGVILLPGLDMAFVLASALVRGPRAGLAAVLGIVAGGVCHTCAAATGVSVLIAVSPVAFNVVLLVGAAYMAWIGLAVFRSGSGGALSVQPGTAARSTGATFRQAALTNLLNPKAYVFMLAVFPQFIRPGRGPVAAQAAVLGAIIAATQTTVYGALALGAGGARGWLAARPEKQALLSRAVGGVLLASAAVCAVRGLR